MTNTYTNNFYTKTFIATLSILLLTGISAAAVTNAGSPEDIEIGQSSISQNISSLDFDANTNAEINVSSLADKSGVQDDSFSLSVDGSNTSDGDLSYDTGTGNITIQSTASNNVTTVTSVKISGINTSQVSTTYSGLDYEAYQDGTTGTSKTYALVDTTDPADLSIDTPASLTYKQSSTTDFTVGYSYTDASPSSATVELVNGSGVQAEYSIDDTGYAGDNSEKQESLDLSNEGLSDGSSYDVNVTVTDEGGNDATVEQSDFLTVDDSSPEVNNFSPDELQSDGSITFDVSDSVSGVDFSSLKLNLTDQSEGDVLQDAGTGSSAISENGGEVTVDLSDDSVSGFDEGDLTLSLEVDDTAGNTEDQADFTATIDDTKPDVSEVTVRDNSSVGDDVVNDSDSVFVEAKVTEENSIESVKVNISDFVSGTQTIDLTSETGSDLYNASFDVGNPTASDGDVGLTVNATDDAGNFNDSESDSVTLDTSTPTVSITNPNDAVEVQSQEYINGTASEDTTSISLVELTIANEAGDTYDGSSFTSTDTTVEANFNGGDWDLDVSSITSEDDYTVTATAEDEAGNSADSSSVTYTIDSTAPSVTGVTVTDGNNNVLNNSEDLVIEATVTDENTISSVSADASDLDAGDVTLTNEHGDVYNATVASSETTIDSEGTATVTVNATDNAGNFNDAKSSDIEYDAVAPVVDSAEYRDSDKDGEIDRVAVTFNESVSYSSFNSGDWAVTSNGLNNLQLTGLNSVNDDEVVLDASVDSKETGVAEADSEPTVDVDATTGVKDEAGNEADNAGPVTAADEADPVVTFGEGLNMISFPSTVGSYSLDTILDNQANEGTSDIEAIWAYTDNGWKKHDPSQSTNNLETIEGGQGYMLKASSGASGKIVADVDDGDTSTMTPSTVSLSRNRWNLVGHYEETPQSVANAGASGLNAGYIDQLIKRDGSGSYTGHSSDIMPGSAYWVSANAEDTYEPQFVS